LDSVFIKDLRVQAILGIHAWEREHPQEIVINIALSTDTTLAAASDAIHDCVDYQTIAEGVKSHVVSCRRWTVEALAEDISRIVLSMPGVLSTRVRVEKPAALDFCQGVGVEIERQAPCQVLCEGTDACDAEALTADTICLGLGSNTNAAANLRAALEQLRRQFPIEAVSSAWESAAEGVNGAPYLNAAVLLRSLLSRDELTAALRRIEETLGRERAPGSTAVAVDLDILLCGDQVQRAELWNRVYCAVPAAELLPSLSHPETLETLSEAARRLANRTPIRRRTDVFPAALTQPTFPAEAAELPKDFSS